MDEMVLKTQQWLNKTYSGKSGYEIVKEDGKTGWSTIYSLIEGLQIELGITSLSRNFGTTTSSYFDSKITPNLKNGYSNNIVFIIQGAFWCKGITPGAFDGLFSNSTQNAINSLQTYAGFTNSEPFTSKWAKALFDMSAFVNLGDIKIREMQQWLNKNYNQYFGILPCDGIYQRATNTALIYALQCEEGLAVGVANGTYGPTTTNLTPTLSQGQSGRFVTILQYSLYVNSFYLNGVIDGTYTSEVSNAVKAFQSFMVLPITGIANMPTIKALLSSAGDPNRTASGIDTATQLNSAQIQTLVEKGVKYVGRYLTGSVGSNYVPKNLTASEISLIINAGISIFPIYEDGGYILTHFTASQGDIDGLTASLTAKELGIPYGTTIYYAVDVDIEDGNIEGTVIPYFKNVYSQTTALGYRVGVYGTRNVCLKVSNAGYATASFVANMSTGWSGNLGFAMPHNWSFDQYNEFTMGTGAGALPVDQDTVSGRDLGFNTVTINKVQEIQAKLVSIGNILPILKEPAIGTISFNEEKMFVSGPYRVYIYLSEEANIGPTTDPFILNISNGKLTNKFMSDLTSFYDVATMPVGFQKQEVYNMIADNISEGKLSVSPIKRTDEVSPGIQLKFEYFDENNSNQSTTWKIQVFLRRETVLTNQPNDIDAFNVLMQCSQNVIGSTDVPNFLRMLETFISMTKQPDNIQISKTIATAGFITLVGAVMIGILLLPVA